MFLLNLFGEFILGYTKHIQGVRMTYPKYVWTTNDNCILRPEQYRCGYLLNIIIWLVTVGRRVTAIILLHNNRAEVGQLPNPAADACCQQKFNAQMIILCITHIPIQTIL